MALRKQSIAARRPLDFRETTVRCKMKLELYDDDTIFKFRKPFVLCVLTIKKRGHVYFTLGIIFFYSFKIRR